MNDPLVVPRGSCQPADLEVTQDFQPLPPGVWIRSADPDTISADYRDNMRSYRRAPHLSEGIK